jgi:hypothetical protein
VKLQLAIGEKEEGYIDAYFGPPEWQAEAKLAPRPLPELAAAGRGALGAPAQPRRLPPRFDGAAAARLPPCPAQGGVDAGSRMMQGEKLAFAGRGGGPVRVPPRAQAALRYDPVLARLEKLVPGKGPLSDRVDAFQERFTVPRDRLDPVMRAAIDECRRRTAPHIALPANERFTLEFVTGKSWGGYNWYKGDSNSLIQINTDLPVRISRAVDLGCHEGYPGHHVYNMLLEQRLAKERGWVEFTLYPLYSPQSFIAEGSANYGIELAFPPATSSSPSRPVPSTRSPACPPRAPPDTAALQEAAKALAGARFTIAADYLDGRIAGRKRWS